MVVKLNLWMRPLKEKKYEPKSELHAVAEDPQKEVVTERFIRKFRKDKVAVVTEATEGKEFNRSTATVLRADTSEDGKERALILSLEQM